MPAFAFLPNPLPLCLIQVLVSVSNFRDLSEVSAVGSMGTSSAPAQAPHSPLLFTWNVRPRALRLHLNSHRCSSLLIAQPLFYFVSLCVRIFVCVYVCACECECGV